MNPIINEVDKNCPNLKDQTNKKAKGYLGLYS